MNKRDTTTVLDGLEAARDVIKNERAEYFDCHVSYFTGKVARKDQPTLKWFDNALRKIDKALAVVDPGSSAIKKMLAQGCIGLPPGAKVTKGRGRG